MASESLSPIKKTDHHKHHHHIRTKEIPKQDVECWNYDLHGKDWLVQTSGRIQSPIDLPARDLLKYKHRQRTSTENNTTTPATPPIALLGGSTAVFHYPKHSSSEKATFFKSTFPHTSLQMTLKDESKNWSVTIDQKRFKVVQFHFHRPAEHLLDGMRAPLELHIVHKFDKSLDENCRKPFTDALENEMLVVAFVFDTSGEKPNPLLHNVLKYAALAEAQAGEGFAFDLRSLVVEGGKYMLRYDGSLTTPPLTEAVNWLVSVAAIPAHAEQLDMLRECIGGTRGNFRVIQGKGTLLPSCPADPSNTACAALQSRYRPVWPVTVSLD